MSVKYLKNPKTKEKFYPITKSDCIVDAFSINNLEIDKLFQDSLSVSKYQRGMSYLNLQGLIHYHSKIKDCFNNIPKVQIYTAGENITIENNVISAEVDLSGYATEQWIDDNYQKKQPEYVDLGLPSGLLWATCNVGATTPEEYGYYFAWGETQTKSTYSWSTYKWCNGNYNTQTKYCTNSSYGTVDNKTVLDKTDDAAAVHWGGSWRMPTDAEWAELSQQCTWTWTTQNSVKGYKVTSKTNGNSIFLPAAGYRKDSSLYESGSGGNYWSSQLYTVIQERSWSWHFYSSSENRLVKSYRYYGQAVRPVCEPTPNINNTKTKEEIINSTDGVYYFTTDTKQIYRNGESYGGNITDLSEYATKQWVEDKNLIIAQALNLFHNNQSWQNE